MPRQLHDFEPMTGVITLGHLEAPISGDNGASVCLDHSFQYASVPEIPIIGGQATSGDKVLFTLGRPKRHFRPYKKGDAALKS